MKNTLYKAWLSMQGDKLQGQNFYPLPPLVKKVFTVFRVGTLRQMQVFAQMLDGADLSFLAPNEYGCIEAVSRIWHELFGYEVFTYTPHAIKYLENSNNFFELTVKTTDPEMIRKTVPDGAIVIAVTGTGNGSIPNGHACIKDGGVLWNNRSKDGKWVPSYTLRTFIARYEIAGGMKVRYFVPRMPKLSV